MASPDGRPGWMVPADEVIMEDLRERRLDYPPLVASRCGLHVTFAKRRCRELAERGLLERATTEATYRITRRGERYLDEGAGEDTVQVEPDAASGR